MKNKKQNIKSKDEELELRIKENRKVDFKDHHSFVNLEHSGGCDSIDV